MNSSPLPTASAAPEAPPARTLPSGRSVVVKVTGAGEELEVRSPEGGVEVRILLTEQGPVIRLSGARLELDTPDAVAVNCRRFEVTTTEGTQLDSAGAVNINGQEVRVRTKDDIHLNGTYVRLNC